MLTVTLSFLRRQLEPACQDAQDAFCQRYPSGVAPLHEVVAALAEHPWGIDWFDWLTYHHGALRPFRAVYREAVNTAWDTYFENPQTTLSTCEDATRTVIRDIARQLAEQAGAQGEV